MTSHPQLVPDGVPPLLRRRQAALVLGISETSLNGLQRRGQIQALQTEPGTWHYYHAEEVARYATSLGIEPAWELALE